MEYRPLYINIISAEDLKNVKHFSKMDVFVKASLAGYPQSKKKTVVDKNCGTNPRWNQRMEFIVDEPYVTKPGLSLFFELKAEGTFNHKTVGTVSLPIHDLYNSATATEDQTAEFQLVTASGKPKGKLKISYRFGDIFKQEVNQAAKSHANEPAMAYPPQYAAPYHPPQYPPQAGYAQASGYGYQAPPPPGYGYAPAAAYAAQKPKKNRMGGGLGLGLGAGLLGGLLVGEMASDIGDASAYADGYDDAMGDMGGFDF